MTLIAQPLCPACAQPVPSLAKGSVLLGGKMRGKLAENEIRFVGDNGTTGQIPFSPLFSFWRDRAPSQKQAYARTRTRLMETRLHAVSGTLLGTYLLGVNSFPSDMYALGRV